MAHTHKHEKRVWLPDAHLVKAIAYSADGLRSSDEEFEKAFRILRKYPARVTIFGSARSKPDSRYYQESEELAKILSDEGYAIVTGGSGGIMEAANKGAFDSGGKSIGFNIVLPMEQIANKYTTDSLLFQYFFTRKVMMTFYSHGFVFFPGGYGTMDELFEVLTLIQTKKAPTVPVILVGSSYWNDLDNFIKKQLLENGYISKKEDQLYYITDDIYEICHIINKDYDT